MIHSFFALLIDRVSCSHGHSFSVESSFVYMTDAPWHDPIRCLTSADVQHMTIEFATVHEFSIDDWRISISNDKKARSFVLCSNVFVIIFHRYSIGIETNFIFIYRLSSLIFTTWSRTVLNNWWAFVPIIPLMLKFKRFSFHWIYGFLRRHEYGYVHKKICLWISFWIVKELHIDNVAQQQHSTGIFAGLNRARFDWSICFWIVERKTKLFSDCLDLQQEMEQRLFTVMVTTDYVEHWRLDRCQPKFFTVQWIRAALGRLSKTNFYRIDNSVHIEVFIQISRFDKKHCKFNKHRFK